MADNIPDPFQFEPRYNAAELQRRQEEQNANPNVVVEVDDEPVREEDRIRQHRLEGMLIITWTVHRVTNHKSRLKMFRFQ